MHVTGLDSRNPSLQASFGLPSPEGRALLPSIFKRWLFLQVTPSPSISGCFVPFGFPCRQQSPVVVTVRDFLFEPPDALPVAVAGPRAERSAALGTSTAGG